MVAGRLFEWIDLWCYARSKLAWDPVYEALYEATRDSSLPLSDLGCGIGLLGFYLRERGLTFPIVGVDVDSRKIGVARLVARRAYQGVTYTLGDASTADPSPGNIALLDVILYYPWEIQSEWLLRLASQLPKGASIFIRVGVRDRSLRYGITRVQDQLARRSRWINEPTLHFPAKEDLLALFDPEQFDCRATPLWGTTPFNSYFFTITRRWEHGHSARVGEGQRTGKVVLLKEHGHSARVGEGQRTGKVVLLKEHGHSARVGEGNGLESPFS